MILSFVTVLIRDQKPTFLLLAGVSVLSLPNLSGTSTGRDIIVMFDTLGVSFRILASQKMLNVITVIGNNNLKGKTVKLNFYVYTGLKNYN